MKYILLSFAVIITIAACQNKEDISSVPIVPVYNNSVLSDTAKADAGIEPLFAESSSKRPTVKRTIHTAVPRSRSSQTIYQPPVVTSPVVTPVPTSPGVNTESSSAGVGNNEGSGTVSTTPQPVKKKGWSKAAKGAVIGGAAGAIGGAIISKKKGLGAVIGGVVGAAGGYAIGKGMDKKDNRFAVK